MTRINDSHHPWTTESRLVHESQYGDGVTRQHSYRAAAALLLLLATAACQTVPSPTSQRLPLDPREQRDIWQEEVFWHMLAAVEHGAVQSDSANDGRLRRASFSACGRPCPLPAERR
jgi:hypothetical protein